MSTSPIGPAANGAPTSSHDATSSGERSSRLQLPPDVRSVPETEGKKPLVTAKAVNDYLDSKLLTKPFGGDPFFQRFQERADEAGMRRIAVTMQQGQFLTVLLKGIGAERVLEIGTLAGVSTAFLSLGLPPHGQLDTLELSTLHAKIAQENFLDADLFPFPKIHVGPALDTLKRLQQPPEGGYDLGFIDADKERILEYFLESLRLVRKGGLIVVDNAVREGRIALEHNDDPSIDVTGLRKLYDWIQADAGKTVLASGIQTVGKFWDGFAIITKL